MGAMKCDLCGGKLVMGSGGIATCDSCGMDYSQERMKEKVQEITGVVKVSNIADVDSFMKRGKVFLEDSDWKQANEYFTKALDIDAHYAPAYIGRLCASLKLNNELELQLEVRPFNENSDYIKALRFADTDYKATLTMYHNDVLENNKHAQLALSIARERVSKYKGCIASSSMYLSEHIVGLKTYGTVVAVGNNDVRQCSVSEWRGIVAVAAGGYHESVTTSITTTVNRAHDGHTVGLKADGTVFAVGGTTGPGGTYSKGWDSKGKCKVHDWSDIIAIAAGEDHTVGLKSNGNVLVAFGGAHGEKKEIANWRNIIAIAANGYCTAGLKSDGTVVSTECDVSSWQDIVSIAVSKESRYSYPRIEIAGLKSDGTVVVTDEKDEIVPAWKNIIAITYKDSYIIGLKVDGTVVCSDSISNNAVATWRDIVAIYGGVNIIGLKADGTVVTTGSDEVALNISSWRDIGPIAEELKSQLCVEIRQENAHKAREAEQRKVDAEAAAAKRKTELEAERRRKGQCIYCGSSLKGLFTKTCTSFMCGKTQ